MIVMIKDWFKFIFWSNKPKIFIQFLFITRFRRNSSNHQCSTGLKSFVQNQSIHRIFALHNIEHRQKTTLNSTFSFDSSSSYYWWIKIQSDRVENEKEKENFPFSPYLQWHSIVWHWCRDMQQWFQLRQRQSRQKHESKVMEN